MKKMQKIAALENISPESTGLGSATTRNCSEPASTTQALLLEEVIRHPWKICSESLLLRAIL
jgi:hypothetical protein